MVAQLIHATEGDLIGLKPLKKTHNKTYSDTVQLAETKDTDGHQVLNPK